MGVDVAYDSGIKLISAPLQLTANYSEDPDKPGAGDSDSIRTYRTACRLIFRFIASFLMEMARHRAALAIGAKENIW